ncbi:MAG: ACP S-malonyltransferase [Planctomycetota bacterium]
MSTRAILFPGQGAQFVGMSAALIERCPETRAMFDAASRLLDLDLWQVTTSGPEELLNSTAVSQPAIFVVSLAVVRAIERAGGTPRLAAAAVAGLSLGEYSALVYAGAIDFEIALEVVVQRGRFMQEACDRTPGGMTSLIGLERAQVQALVEEVRELGVIAVANVNADNQIVVSGERAPLDRIATLAPERGAKRVVPLKVAGAYHSPLMSSASSQLRPFLERAQIRPPRLPFYQNVTAQPETRPEQIRAGLLKQIEAPVLWAPTLKAMLATGVTDFLEVGPGRVLAGLAKQIDKRLPVTSLLSAESVAEFLA